MYINIVSTYCLYGIGTVCSHISSKLAKHSVMKCR